MATPAPARATAVSDVPAPGKGGEELKACPVATYQKMYKPKYFMTSTAAKVQGCCFDLQSLDTWFF